MSDWLQAVLALVLTIVALGPFVALGVWMLWDAERMGLDMRLFPPRDERGQIIPRDGKPNG